ncbi:hypothetical protein [Chitinilyticum piscinae]|uniref:Uncharacterized protein n=1 Tax=Chitinilyticum piscinae TaxID=2866724 RepID=A0A8J7FGB6_9NEIS|nr:hypothetical protein [Chitinilyticum piscinae]MBE9608868.1 hypothetical protein [Chitinilyticum piscinae]
MGDDEHGNLRARIDNGRTQWFEWDHFNRLAAAAKRNMNGIPITGKTKSPEKSGLFWRILAERGGFEPPIGY